MPITAFQVVPLALTGARTSSTVTPVTAGTAATSSTTTTGLLFPTHG